MRQIFRFMIYFFLILLSACKENNPVDEYKPPTIPIYYPSIDDYPAWSTDGLRIIYNHYGITKIYPGGMYSINPDSSGLWMMNADGSNQRLILRGFEIYAAWSPDRLWIAYHQGGQIYKIPVVGDSLDNSRIKQLTVGRGNFFPAWSPDVQWIAYDSDENTGNRSHYIWIMKSDGSQKRRIAYEPTMGEIRTPNWSPDGKKIAHLRYLVGTFSSEIFSMDTNGENSIRLTDNNATDRHPKYSPDGTKIVFQSQPYGSVPQICVMDADGNNPKMLTTTGGEYPSWSPDGKKIVYVGWTDMRHYHPQTNGTVWVMNADGTCKTQLTFGPSPSSGKEVTTNE